MLRYLHLHRLLLLCLSYLLQQPNHLILRNLALERSSLGILEDNLLQTFSFFWLYGSDVSHCDTQLKVTRTYT